MATTPKAENHPNWKGGMSERTHKARQVIKARIKQIGKCERCGETKHLQGHHILPHSTHPHLRAEPTNIEVLCSQCHAKEHPEFQGMISIPRKRSGTEISCVICGKKRYVNPYALATAKFCSRPCKMISLQDMARERGRKSRLFPLVPRGHSKSQASSSA